MNEAVRLPLASIERLQREADRLEAERQLGAAAHALIGSRDELIHRLREAAYPLSTVTPATLPTALGQELGSIWKCLTGAGPDTPHVLAKIDAMLAGMRTAEMAILAARIVALHDRMLTLGGGHRTLESL